MFGLAALAASSAQASFLSQSEIHVTGIQASALNGSLSWVYSPGLNFAATNLFDNISGSVQAYDDDLGSTGQASASSAATLSSASAFASSTQGKIDVNANVNSPGSTVEPISYSAYGEVYNLFQVNGKDPVQVNFSLNYTAQFSGSSTVDAYALAYLIQLVVSDGINNYSNEVFDTLPVKGTLNVSPSGILSFSQILQPNTYYSFDVISQAVLAQYVPEPSSLSLLLGGSLIARRFFRAKIKPT